MSKKEDNMKRTLLTLSILMMTLFAVKAQPKLSFDNGKYDFGAIMWKQPATAKFVITNTGNKPLVIHKVETSCGCVVSTWSKKPIRPNRETVIEATYDARMLGHFHKFVRIYSNATAKPVDLSMIGLVSSTIVDYSRNYPIQIGSIHLDTDHIEFADANKGDSPSFELKVANGSSKDYAPVLMHLPSYIEAQAIPERLAPKEVGVIRLTFHSDKAPFFGINRTTVYLSRYPGDTVGEDNQLELLSVLLPDFSNLNAQQKALAPSIRLSAHTLDLGSVGEKKKLKGVVTITNDGRSDLKFQDLQVTHPALNVSLKKQTLAPGKSVKLHITVNAKFLRGHLEHTPRVLMITNDPKHPKAEIKINVTK
ncbi:MAG TPA: hypothetical protein DCZ73_05035 [Bacteroides sp.]|nr:hypothetical protein [Bacteroides sp.]